MLKNAKECYGTQKAFGTHSNQFYFILSEQNGDNKKSDLKKAALSLAQP